MDGAKCRRMTDRKGNQCRGEFIGALGADDWLECPSCGATGREFVGRCTQCEGDRWILARTPG